MEMLAKTAALCLLIVIGVLTPKPAKAEVYSQGQWTCVIGRIKDGTGWVSEWSQPTCTYTPTNEYTPPPIDAEQVMGCRYFRSHKPCAQPVEMPYQYDFGRSSLYQNGSAMPKLIYLANTGLLMPGIPEQVKAALHEHTGGLAVYALPAPLVHQTLLDRMKVICTEQGTRALYGALGTQKCWEATNQLAAEMGDDGLGSLADWLQRQGLEASVSIGVDAKMFNFSLSYKFSDPINSLKAKADAVSAASTCAQWWEDARAEGCAM